MVTLKVNQIYLKIRNNLITQAISLHKIFLMNITTH